MILCFIFLISIMYLLKLSKTYMSSQKCSPDPQKNFVAHMLERITSATPFIIFKKGQLVILTKLFKRLVVFDYLYKPQTLVLFLVLLYIP